MLYIIKLKLFSLDKITEIRLTKQPEVKFKIILIWLGLINFIKLNPQCNFKVNVFVSTTEDST